MLGNKTDGSRKIHQTKFLIIFSIFIIESMNTVNVALVLEQLYFLLIIENSRIVNCSIFLLSKYQWTNNCPLLGEEDKAHDF